MPEDSEFVEKITLYAILPVQGLLGQLDGGFIAEPRDRDVLQKAWETANDSYSHEAPDRSYATDNDIRPTTEVSKTVSGAILARVRNYAPYDSHKTTIANVRISKLVTPQIAVNVARAGLRANVTEGMTEDQLVRLMTESAGSPEPITRQILGLGPTTGAVLFTSYDEDIRIHHPPQYRELPINTKDVHSSAFESVCFPVGGGLSFAAVSRIQVMPGVYRLILTNGIHRAYRLAAAGYEWCPFLVTEVTPMEFPEQFVDLPKELLLEPEANPPLVTDFTRTDLAIRLKYHKVLKTIRLNWNFEQYATVLK